VAVLPARLAAALATAVALTALGAAAASAGPRAAAAPQRPNVIVVMTDDQTVAELSDRSMPETMRKIAGEGTEFTRSFVSSPLCCPSRAGYITGQYPHNSGVFDNEPGYPALIDKTSTLYTWLQGAGYRTGHVGRWLLNYDRASPPGAGYDTQLGLAAPPGVEDWFGYVGSATHYYGATFSDNGQAIQLPGEEEGGPYTTRVINRAAREFVAQAAADPRPFFLTVAPLAPHSSNDLARGYCGTGGLPIPERDAVARWKDEPLPKPPSFGEPKIGDKPAWVSTRPKLKPKRRQALKSGYRCALGTLGTVDRGVGSLVKQLERQDQLADTAIFVTSDNGYFFGEHRLVLTKLYPYEEGIRVPLLARIPPAALGLPAGASAPREVDDLVNNLDLTATILDLANAPSCTAGGDCRALDGHSLVPLLRGHRPAWARQRALLVQLGGKRACNGTQTSELGLNNYYDAIRTSHWLYVELNHVNADTGLCDRPEYELYDLRNDPWQLRNKAVDPAVALPSPVQASLAARLAALRACSGASCG
jgi:arylsulfatase A-like enzyme